MDKKLPLKLQTKLPQYYPFLLAGSLTLTLLMLLTLVGCSGGSKAGFATPEKLEKFENDAELKLYRNYTMPEHHDTASGMELANVPESAGATATAAQEAVEADIYATKGEYIFQANGDKLRITRVVGGSAGTLDKTLTLPTIGGLMPIIREMHLYGEMLLVIADSMGMFNPGVEVLALKESAPIPLVGLFFIDVSTPQHAVIVREARLDGYFADSMRVGSKVYLLGNHYSFDGVDVPRVKQQAEGEFEVLPASSLYASRLAREQVKTSRYENVTVPQHAYTTLAALDLDDLQKALEVRAVFGSGNALLRVSPKSVYIVDASLVSEESTDGDTVVHRFAIDGDKPEYSDSIKVRGRVPTKECVSEDATNRFLRLATMLSTTRSVGDNSFMQITNSEVRFNVLEQKEGVLSEVSVVKDLVKDEILTTAHYIGDMAYVATYKSEFLGKPMPVDPLFTIDLTDHYKPVVRDALKFPGSVAFIKSWDATHLVAVGFTQEWQAKVSLFDIADADDAALLDTQSFEGNSSAQLERRAFSVLDDLGMLALPINMQVEGGGELALQTSQMKVVAVSNTGVNEHATLDFDLEMGEAQRLIHFQGELVALLSNGIAFFDTSFNLLGQQTY